MLNIFNKIKKQKGYALLFAIIIIGSISAVVSGLLSSTTKQLILSSLAKDSLIAFYQVDIGYDCGLYTYMRKEASDFNDGDIFNCGDLYLTVEDNTSDDGFNFVLTPQEDSSPCFSISFIQNQDDITMTAKGYNICDKDNPRTVEREITAEFKNN